MRNRYIRFFISSTFADMESERNLLQEVFETLTKEYSEQGWIIETIDLRWGISNEAGLDNKTMQICKEELRRCQELSPKPNFIILLGNRYGWIPLPETIPYKYWKQIKRVLTEESSKLFEDWYKYDSNALPDGEYVLQPRKKIDNIDYRKKEIWEENVEKPLKKVFKAYLTKQESIKTQFISTFFPRYWPSLPQDFFGLSATNIEILHGALTVDDAEEHVVAYFRDLTDVEKAPSDFQPEDEECDNSVFILKVVLKDVLSQDNIYEEKLSYSNYLPPTKPKEPYPFGNKFKEKMEQKLRNIINQVIEAEASTIPLTENQIHQQFAAGEAAGIIGRNSELSIIDTYIQSSTDSKLRWIKAQSGEGKSVLLSKIADTYKDTHHVICRFCGQTTKSSWADSLISSINDDLHEISQYSEPLGSPAAYFKSIYSDKPIILIIDALDQVANDNHDRFSSLDWLFPYEDVDDFPSNVKVIISSLDNFECSSEKHKYETLPLGNMGSYSFELAYSRVKSAHRRLTSLQCDYLAQLIEKTDKSALYLHILGTYLAKVTDKEDVSTLPTDINGMVNMILDDLERPERHGAIVKEALSMLAVERIGLTDKEIITLLAENEDFYQHFKDDSHHKWNDHGQPKVPPVLWSRLKYDIKPFLREKISAFGIINVFFHKGIKNIVAKRFLRNKDYQFYYEMLYKHYKKTVANHDTHALSELIHCGCMFARYSFSDRRSYQTICQEIHAYMHDRDFVRRIIEKDLNALKDVREVLQNIKGQEKDYIELYQTPNMKMLPSSNFYRKIVDKANLFPLEMKDILADTKMSSIRYVVPSLIGSDYSDRLIADRSVISDDGQKLVYIVDRQKVIIEDLTDPSLTDSYMWPDKIVEIQCSDDLRYHAIRQEDRCFKYDVIEKEVLESYPISKNGWMTMSAKGDLLCEGNQHLDILQAKWATSGCYIWTIGKDFTLKRYNKEQTYYEEYIVELTDKDGNEYNPLTTSEFRLWTCSDTICVIANENCFVFLEYILETGSYRYFVHHRTKYMKIDVTTDIFKFSSEENNFYIHYRDGNICEKYRIEEHGPIYENDFCSSISCINKNGTMYLSYDTVRDIEQEMNIYSSLIQVGMDGVKHISTCNDGHIIGVQSRTFRNSHSYMNLIFNLNQMKWRPPFNTMNYLAISAIAISPNGQFIAVSTLEKHQLGLFFIEKDRESGHSLPDFSVLQASGSCLKITISDDSKYIATADEEKIIVISPQGNTLFLHENIKSDSLDLEGKIQICPNNRFMIVNDYIIDNMQNKTHKSEENLDIYTYLHGNQNALSLNSLHPNPNILLYPHGYILLDANKVNKTDGSKEIIGCSRTGRYLFFLQEGRLFISKWATQEYELLLKSVKCIIPAYNEDYIFVVSESMKKLDPINYASIDTIYLYDIKKQEIVQYCNTSLIAYLAFCAKGLIVARKGGETHLFSPANHIPFNRPAVTTFVRRWNLETKVQEEPTAICPMCGGQIDITSAVREILIDNPQQPVFEDWDKPGLFGHHCPHCNAELRYNPYIF